MFLGVKTFVWIVMLLCIVIAGIFAVVNDILITAKKKVSFILDPGKYLAIGLCCLIAVFATILGKIQGYVGSPMIALIIGILIVNLMPNNKLSKSFKSGTTYAGKKFLNLGIIGLGATLAFTNIFSAIDALPLILFNIVLSFVISSLIGRYVLKVSSNTCTLVGGGTCICGGTAIATLSSILNAKEEETAYAMTAIFLFDLFACLSFPFLAVSLGFTEVQFGFLAGTAINDTSSVVAAQETYANLINLTNYSLPATIKVVRTTMIIVLALFFSFLSARKGRSCDKEATSVSVTSVIWNAFPKFIIIFIVAVTVNTILLNGAGDSVFYTEYFKPFFSNGYKFFVTIALAGVGFKIKFKDLLTKGVRPIALGGCTWLAVFLSSLIYTTCFL